MPAIRFSKISGVTGAVKVGAAVAARFSRWTMLRDNDEVPEGTPATFRFTGEGEVDAHWSTEHPDVLQLDGVNGGTWTWRGVTFEFGDGVVRCTLVGPPEEV